jgi:UDP-glucose 4-epimerase
LKRVEKITQKKVTCIKVDLLDKDALNKVFKDNEISCVIHFAGLKAVGESCSQPLKYYHNNVTGSIILLECMQANNVNQIIFSSSSTVYGDPQYLPLDEKHPTGGCSNPYGSTKLVIEYILKDAAKANDQLHVVSLRYFNPVGAHESGLIGEDPQDIPNNLMPFITQVAIGRRAELSVFGDDYKTKDGTGVRDYIHVVDLARGHVAAVGKMKKGFRAYNLGTGVGYSVLEMVKAMETVVGRPIPHKIVGRRTGDIAENYADASLAKNELEWNAEFGVDRMCADQWRFQEANPMGYQGEPQ